jgi:glycosyltransferase involved in cell wall biosynthesis
VPPFVSVIIPVYNDNARLQTCLDALALQTYPADRFEVVVVDNGSVSPAAGNVSIGSNVRILFESRPGSFVARNTGLAAARGEVVAFTDADCYPERSWIEAGVKALGSSRVVVAGHVEAFPAKPGSPTAVERFEMLFGFEQDKNANRGVSVTANLICRRDVFDEAGYFGTESHSAHDYEWCQQAVARGYRVVYVPDAAVRTPARRSFAALALKMRRMSGASYVRGRSRNRLWAQRLSALRNMRPPLRRIRRALLQPGIGGLRHRAALCCVLMGLPLVYALEWARMEAGLGEAERR